MENHPLYKKAMLASVLAVLLSAASMNMIFALSMVDGMKGRHDSIEIFPTIILFVGGLAGMALSKFSYERNKLTA